MDSSSWTFGKKSRTSAIPVTIQGVGEVPSTIDREANAKVAVRDGQSVVWGGVISSTKSEGRSGVPLLKDIPVLGALFRIRATTPAAANSWFSFVQPCSRHRSRGNRCGGREGQAARDFPY